MKRIATMCFLWCLSCRITLMAAAEGNLLQNFNKDENQSFSKRICKLARFRKRQVNILYRNSIDKETEEWQSLYQCLAELPLVIRNLDLFVQEPSRSSSSLNIYFITTPILVEKVVNFINPKQRWKQAHHYLFIWLLKDIDLLKDFFLQVWQKDIALAVAAVRATTEIFTFEPFSQKGFQLKLLNHPPYFYDKLKNFYGNELRITMFNDTVRAIPVEAGPRYGYKRVDGWVARTLVERLNATGRYITPADNQTYGALSNGIFSGSLKDIHAGLTHIGLNMRYTLDHVKEHIEELYPYQRRMLYLVVPAAELRPEFLIFVNAFTYTLWRLLTLNFCLVFLIFLLLQYLTEHLPNYNRGNSPKHWLWYEVIEMLFKTQLGEPVEGFAPRSSLRQFLITWIFFSYVLTSIYFAKLESSFVHPAYEPELDNLKDLPQLKAPIYAFDTVFQAIKVSLEPQCYQIIDANGIRVPQNVTIDKFSLSLVQKHKNVAVILHDELARELLAQTYDDDAKKASFHIMKQYLRSLTCSYVLTKGSPFIHKFQTIISAFYEHGFIQHWQEVDSRSRSSYSHNSEEFFEDLGDDFDLEEDDTVDLAPRRKKVVLNLGILQGAFHIWLCGLLLSCLGFGIEHIHWWRKMKGKRHINVNEI